VEEMGAVAVGRGISPAAAPSAQGVKKVVICLIIIVDTNFTDLYPSQSPFSSVRWAPNSTTTILFRVEAESVSVCADATVVFLECFYCALCQHFSYPGYICEPFIYYDRSFALN